MTIMKPQDLFIPYIALYLCIGMLLITGGCGSGSESDSNSTANAEIGVPPSISQEKTQNVVTIPEDQAQQLNIQLYTVETQNAHFTISAPGQTFAAPGHISAVSSPINGRVAKIYVHEGERIAKGDPLLDLESLEYADLVANYLEAVAEINYQEQQVERLTVLTEEEISARRTLERAQADLIRAQTKRSTALARLSAVGITPKDASKWDLSSSEPKAKLTIRAPISGVINEHLIELGESVNAYGKLLDIIDNSHVMVKGFVSPADAPFVGEGTAVIISQKTEQSRSANKQISGTVTSINPALDQDNRSLVLNSIVKTQEGWPLVGQRVRLQYRAESQGALYAIPLSAIQFDQQQPAVFIQKSQRQYVKQYVTIERMTGTRALIKKGLKPGDKVAITQVFSLKALDRLTE